MAYHIDQKGGGTVTIHFEDWKDLGKAMKEVISGDPNLLRKGIGTEDEVAKKKWEEEKEEGEIYLEYRDLLEDEKCPWRIEYLGEDKRGQHKVTMAPDFDDLYFDEEEDFDDSHA